MNTRHILQGTLALAASVLTNVAFAGVVVERPVAVPEPGTLGLLAAGVAAAAVARLRKRK
jgi:hypothetical protein